MACYDDEGVVFARWSGGAGMEDAAVDERSLVGEGDGCAGVVEEFEDVVDDRVECY